MELQVLEKVRQHYVKELGKERGALSEFARNLGLDPRVVNNWDRLPRAIPSIYASDIERVTKGAVKEQEIIAEDLAYMKARKEAMYARRRRVVA
jgi:DNA-binding transcriptional regulator YdaS (Cro superfamily)